MKPSINLALFASAALGMTLFFESALAQQGTLKQQLVGTWTLVSCDAKQPYCVSPRGTLIFDANGRYAQVIAAAGRPKATGAAPADRTGYSPEYL